MEADPSKQAEDHRNLISPVALDHWDRVLLLPGFKWTPVGKRLIFFRIVLRYSVAEHTIPGQLTAF